MTGARLSDYLHEIYERGHDDQRPALPTDLIALEDAARAHLSPAVFGYAASTAGSGATARANREAFDRWQLVPRMLTGATERDPSTTVLGHRLPAPVLTAPVGAQGIMHRDGELATARAAASVGVPTVLSTLSSYSLEEVAEASGDGGRWFQLYRPADDEVCCSFLARARAAGYSALVLTVDNWTLAWRPKELDHAFLPFLTGRGLGTYFSDPVFAARLARPPAQDVGAAVETWRAMFSGTDRTWADLAFVREHWDGPILVKGIQHPDDARRAVDAGMDGVVVSNHGGRQLDGALGSLDALPGVVAAVGDRTLVLFDSGVRTGADVLKALALGAAAVLVGRPWLYGLALDGEAGVRHVLRCLLADVDLSLGLSGHRGVGELGPHTLRAR